MTCSTKTVELNVEELKSFHWILHLASFLHLQAAVGIREATAVLLRLPFSQHSVIVSHHNGSNALTLK